MQTANDKHQLLSEYYLAHCNEIRNFVAGRIGSQELAKDIVQDIFTKLLSSTVLLNPITLPALVHTMAHHFICDYWRHRKITDEFAREALYADLSGKDNSLSPENVCCYHETAQILEYSIMQLKEPMRIPYRMNIMEGKKVSEISKILAIDYKQAENRLTLARKQIREMIRQRLGA